MMRNRDLDRPGEAGFSSPVNRRIVRMWLILNNCYPIRKGLSSRKMDGGRWTVAGGESKKQIIENGRWRVDGSDEDRMWKVEWGTRQENELEKKMVSGR
jgi:hypothetical protein